MLSKKKSCRPKKRRLRIWTDRMNLEDWPALLKSIANDHTLAEISAYSRQTRGFNKKLKRRCCNARENIEKLNFQNRRHSRRLANFLPRSLVEAISSCARNSSAVTSVALQGIPLTLRHLKTLCEGLKFAKNLQLLSLARCRIGDGGCALVLNGLSESVNLCFLDLTSCRLTGLSGSLLSIFLKKKKEKNKEKTSVLHNACREQDNPYIGSGIHTLVLNHNPKFGDRGLRPIIDVLRRDFSIKTLNLRDCGLTSRSTDAVTKLLKTNNVLVKIDLKENEIPVSTMRNLTRILRGRLRKVERSIPIPIQKNKKKIFSGKKNQQRSEPNKNDLRKSTTPRHDMYSRTKTAQPKSQSRNSDVAKLTKRLSGVIFSNAALLRELVSDKELLAEMKTRRVDMEKEFSELEPRVEKLRDGIRERDQFCARISEEGKLFGCLKKFLTQLGGLSGGSVGRNLAWKIVPETELQISAPTARLDLLQGRKTRPNDGLFTQRVRPNCPRKLQSGN